MPEQDWNRRREEWNLRVKGIRFADPGEVEGRAPDFAIIGAPKAATSSMAALLGEHPGVYMVPIKELHFFNASFERGADWYRAQFAAAPPGVIAGEATPDYLAEPEAPARMAAMMPGAKLIAILREPIDRAYSHYWMQRSKFPNGMEFAAVVRREMNGPTSPTGYPPLLEPGRYVEHLERFCEHFPRASILVLPFEDFVADPRGVFAQTCRFLGIDDTFEPEGLDLPVNPTRRVRSERIRRLMLRLRLGARVSPRFALWLDNLNRVSGYPAIDPDLEQELAAWYADDNRRLGEFLDRDLSRWDEARSNRRS